MPSTLLSRALDYTSALVEAFLVELCLVEPFLAERCLVKRFTRTYW